MRYPTVAIESRSELRRWLEAHHATAQGAWVITFKKAAGGQVAWNDVVEEALCFGWVDSLPRKLDEQRTMLLVTPRKPTSKWSAKNKAHIADLEARGQLHPSGRAAVDRAKGNGMWSALDEVSALRIPDDLEAALAGLQQAKEKWLAFPPSARRGILEWIDGAKRPETRSARVAETAQLAARGIRANQWRREKP